VTRREKQTREKRLELSGMTHDEARRPTPVFVPDGKARAFHFRDGKAKVGHHAFPRAARQLDGAGFYEITGMPWSGRGKISRVGVFCR